MRTRPLMVLLFPGLLLATACGGLALPGADRVLASQPGPNRATWQLTGVRERDGQVLVTLTIDAGEARGDVLVKVDGISLIDDATAKRYVVLRGADGEYLGAKASGPYLRGSADNATALWMKFAAPPAGTRTVSIALPNVGTFDGIPIDR